MGNRASPEVDLVVLERFVATNRSIKTLNLEVERRYLDAIAKGLVQRRQRCQQMIALTLEPPDRNPKEPEVTGVSLRMFNQNMVRRLCLWGSYCVDLFAVCSALQRDSTLTAFEMNVVLEPPSSADQRDPLEAVLELFKNQHDFGAGYAV